MKILRMMHPVTKSMKRRIVRSKPIKVYGGNPLEAGLEIKNWKINQDQTQNKVTLNQKSHVNRKTQFIVKRKLQKTLIQIVQALKIQKWKPNMKTFQRIVCIRKKLK